MSKNLTLFCVELEETIPIYTHAYVNDKVTVIFNVIIGVGRFFRAQNSYGKNTTMLVMSRVLLIGCPTCVKNKLRLKPIIIEA